MAFAQKELFIDRTFELARKGFRTSGKNPCVGSVLVHNGKIIGEGFYRTFGGPHAEVDCINSVADMDKSKIGESTLYVSLEPCSIFGKTPPCANFIIQHNIPRVIISCLDPNPKISGNGVKILQEHGVDVEVGVLKEQGEELIRKFRINILQERPFIALKWAQSKNGFAGKNDEPVWYTNDYAKIFAHKLRSQYEAILIANKTVNIDNPGLDNRLYNAETNVEQPIKIVIDRNGSINPQSIIFHKGTSCLIYTYEKAYPNPNPKLCTIVHMNDDVDQWAFIFSDLYKKGISSVLVEGGPSLQKDLIKKNWWNMTHVLSSNNEQMSGIRAPRVTGKLLNRLSLGDNTYQCIVPWILQ